jgi:hypothetical protein
MRTKIASSAAALILLAVLCPTPLFAADESAWNALPETEKQRVLENHERWKQMSPERKDALSKRFEHYRSLSPEQKQRIARNFQWFRNLPPERKEMIRSRMKKFRALSPEERAKRIRLLKERRSKIDRHGKFPRNRRTRR